MEVGPEEEGVPGGGEETQGAGEPDLRQRTLLHRGGGQDPGEATILAAYLSSRQESEAVDHNQDYGQVLCT